MNTKGPKPSSASLAAPIDDGTITASKFTQIHSGMSYEDVVDIMGSPGSEQSSSDVAGFNTTMVQWANADGSNAMIMFQNGRVTMKSQFGLR